MSVAHRDELPVVDLSSLPPRSASTGTDIPLSVVDEVAAAAESHGFFQVTGHGIPSNLIAAVWAETHAFFAQPMPAKRSIARTKENTRGYYDRELTKNRRDLKEVLDLAHVPYPDLPATDLRNHHRVDGANQWPDIASFRDTMVEYLLACEELSLRLLQVFCLGLDEPAGRLQSHFGADHTSFVRLNHYPLADPLADDEAAATTDLGDMALHHHTDAGALTVLLQDEVGGLQVRHGDGWIDVEPIPDAFVINTGDMMQVWSNDRYRAALHRVAPLTDKARYSLPYFFNPSYDTDYAPLPGAVAPGDRPHYGSINWGAFRQARADGDYGDYGAENQISDHLIG